MVENFQTAAEAAVTLAGAVASGAIGFVVPAVLRRLRVADQADLAARLEKALDAWVGVAIKFGADYAAAKLAERFPDAMRTLSLDQSHIAESLQARVDTHALKQPNTAIAPRGEEVTADELNRRELERLSARRPR